MAPLIEIDISCIPSRPARLVYILAPGTLVRLGPDLDRAIRFVVESLQAVLTGSRHFATTYSLAHITIVLDDGDSREDVPTHVFRLRFIGDRLTGSPDRGLVERIVNQIHDIHLHQPNLQLPWFCVEDWRGFGPKDHQIYNDMVKASTSVDAWKVFKNSLRTSIKPNGDVKMHRITIDDICNFNDAALARFLQVACRTNGDYKIHDSKNVPPAKIALLCERIGAATKQPGTSLDMKELATRLIAIATGKDTPPRPFQEQLLAPPSETRNSESAYRKEEGAGDLP